MSPFNKDGSPVKPFNEHGMQSPAFEVGDIALHGDVIIERVADLPLEAANLPIEPNSCLAYGEATLHIHHLVGTPGKDFEVRVATTGERLLKIVNPTALKHQEHSPIVLPPGMYRTGVQQEYDPFTKKMRQVAD